MPSWVKNGHTLFGDGTLVCDECPCGIDCIYMAKPPVTLTVYVGTLPPDATGILFATLQDAIDAYPSGYLDTRAKIVINGGTHTCIFATTFYGRLVGINSATITSSTGASPYYEGLILTTQNIWGGRFFECIFQNINTDASSPHISLERLCHCEVKNCTTINGIDGADVFVASPGSGVGVYGGDGSSGGRLIIARLENSYVHDILLGNGGNGGNGTAGTIDWNTVGGGGGGSGGRVDVGGGGGVINTIFENITFGQGGNGGNGVANTVVDDGYHYISVSCGYGGNGGYMYNATYLSCSFIDLIFGDAGNPGNSNWTLGTRKGGEGSGGGGFGEGGAGGSGGGLVYNNFPVTRPAYGRGSYGSQGSSGSVFCPLCYFSNIIFGIGSSGKYGSGNGGNGGYGGNGGDGGDAGSNSGSASSGLEESGDGGDGGDVFSDNSLQSGLGGTAGTGGIAGTNGTDGTSEVCP